MFDTTIITVVIGLFASWTATVAIFTYWLNSKFNDLLRIADYKETHMALERRVRNLEIEFAMCSQHEGHDFHPVGAAATENS